METITMATAKRDFQIGYATGFYLVRVPMSTGWMVVVKAGSAERVLVDARSKQAREFRTLDAAISAVEDIGFRVIELR